MCMCMCMFKKFYFKAQISFIKQLPTPNHNILCCIFPIIKLKEYKRTDNPISRIKAEHTFSIFLSYTIQNSDVLGQKLANIFCEGPNSKYFRLCGPQSLCPNSAIIVRKQLYIHINEQIWLYSSITFSTKIRQGGSAFQVVICRPPH